MITKEKVLEIAKKEGIFNRKDIALRFDVSRQYASRIIALLVAQGKLLKIGSTNNALYAFPPYAAQHLEILPTKITKTFRNKNLEEHRVLDSIEADFPLLLKLNESDRSIFTYAFSEMLNNAIEHSGSERILVEVSIQNNILSFVVDDFGIGVFRNIRQKKGLRSELEAIQDLLKGKTTTLPQSHSGEGIFFTSKIGDIFILESYGYRLIADNTLPDIFLEEPSGKKKKGTRVIFQIATTSQGHLNDVFKKYANIDEESNYGFDKTEIQVKLYTIGGVHISRSQARRVLSGLEKFRVIVFDFDKVPVVGQAFADEIFRVFHTAYPGIKLQTTNMNEAVKFMVERATGDNPRNQDMFLK